MNNKIPKDIFSIMNILQNSGYEVWFVGGCVRDMIMKRPCNDYDLTTNATPETMQNLFQNYGFRFITTGIKHGTISVLCNKNIVEITTYRTENNYQDHRHPETINYTSSLKEDLKRRDFTINAIAWHPKKGFVDPFHGKEDIAKKQIRCVGNPKKRFEEDALRILRALRFHCTLHFSIEKQTKQALQQISFLLGHISKERIRNEFNKMLMGELPNTLTLLKDVNVLSYILPNYEFLYNHAQPTPWHCYDIFTHTDIALNHTIAYPLESKLAIIFHDTGKIECEEIDKQGIAHYRNHALISEQKAKFYMQNLKYDKKTIQKVCMLIRYHDTFITPDRVCLRKFLSFFDNNFELAKEVLDIQLSDNYAKNLEKVDEKINIIKKGKKLIDIMQREHDYISLKDLKLSGKDLISLGFQGKKIKDILDILYNYVLEDPNRNTKENLLSYIKKESKQD